VPLIIDGGRIPALWAGKKRSRSAIPIDRYDPRAESVEIALINNMPDPALEDTEMQFFELLDNAAGEIPVRVKLYSLPQVPRGERGQEHLNGFYCGINDLLNSRVDAVIMTGTEPRQPDLRNEPYWAALTEVLDWAEQNTSSTVLSCLAAHAGVLHSDGIQRRPLGDKQFGVFDFRKTCDHALTSRTADLVGFPHSRWNEVQEDALTSCGYSVLTHSAEAGVDLFVKKRKNSLFVHFQGHPEYGVHTLMKEYRRDIKRFLKQERTTYPSTPHGYFDATATKLLAEFQQKALSDPREEIMSAFPEAIVVDTLRHTWQPLATCVYRNWLQFIVSRKAETSVFPAVAGAGRSRAHLSQ